MAERNLSLLLLENQNMKETNDVGDVHVDEQTCFGRLGSQLDNKVEFKNRYGESVWATPIIIDFLRVLQLGQISETNGVISGVSNKDLLHAVVALYDISLADMDTETLYATICNKWSRTIFLVQDLKDAVDDMTERNVKRRRKKNEAREKQKEKEDKQEDKQEEKTSHWSERIDLEKDVLKEEESPVTVFSEVFSDTEDESEEEEEDGEEEEEEDYSKGIHEFITKTIDRRKQRESCEGILSPDTIGIENRLIGCATFEKKFVEHKDRIIHLTLISVRPRYRKYRMGRYLLSKCIAPVIVGPYDAVVVHADNSAVEFFRKFGFSDDTILNSKWSEIADAFTNCTLMSYLPGFSATNWKYFKQGHSLLYTEVTKDTDPDIYDIDHELKSWQSKSREAYQGQLCCMMRLRNEILQLKTLAKSQTELLGKLINDSDSVRQEKLIVEKELMELKINGMRSIFSEATGARNNNNITVAVPSPSASRPSSTPAPHTSTTAEIILRFTQGMEMDRSIMVQYTVTSVMKAPRNDDLVNKFESSVSKMKDVSMVTEMYFCGSLEKPSRLPQILREGFKDQDFTHGEFGRGLYFSKYPSKAAQFSDLGKLLEVKVGLGSVQTVMKYERTRKSASDGHDSIIVPGRLYKPGDQGEVAMLSQEYVIFDMHQILPLCLIYYSANPS